MCKFIIFPKPYLILGNKAVAYKEIITSCLAAIRISEMLKYPWLNLNRERQALYVLFHHLSLFLACFQMMFTYKLQV